MRSMNSLGCMPEPKCSEESQGCHCVAMDRETSSTIKVGSCSYSDAEHDVSCCMTHPPPHDTPNEGYAHLMSCFKDGMAD